MGRRLSVLPCASYSRRVLEAFPPSSKYLMSRGRAKTRLGQALFSERSFREAVSSGIPRSRLPISAPDLLSRSLAGDGNVETYKTSSGFGTDNVSLPRRPSFTLCASAGCHERHETRSFSGCYSSPSRPSLWNALQASVSFQRNPYSLTLAVLRFRFVIPEFRVRDDCIYQHAT